jgi:hypothetical protein
MRLIRKFQLLPPLSPCGIITFNFHRKKQMSFKVKLGRPFADGTDTKKLHVLMPQDLIDKLDMIMRKLMVEGVTGVTRSDAIRYAIEKIHT